MTLTTEQLDRADKQNLADFYNEDEVDLFASYKRHLSLSVKIATAEFYQEAWLELLIAVECLVKDVYCAVRFATWRNKLPSKLEHKEFYERFHFAEASIVKSFGHDLRYLAKHLASVVSDFGSDSDFRKFIEALPADGSWVHRRYRNPQPGDRQHKNTYELLQRRLGTVLVGKLRRWK
jgi:hypothetical protein